MKIKVLLLSTILVNLKIVSFTEIEIKEEQERTFLALLDAYQNNIPQLLALAIERNDYSLTEAIVDIYPEVINQTASVDLKSPKLTPLNRSLDKYQPRYAHLFIDKGANVNLKSKDETENTPLLSAIKYLKELKASPHIKDIHTKTYIKIINLLIDKGADIKDQDSLGHNALYYSRSLMDISELLENILQKKREVEANQQVYKHLPKVLADIVSQYYNKPQK